MQSDNHLVSFYFVFVIASSLLVSTSALSCYQCRSTFPGDQICLSACSTTSKVGNTCVLIRNISLMASDFNTLDAGHLRDFSFLNSISDDEFLFGEEAIYHSPSTSVGWVPEYGPITYGCDTDNCNDPRYINRLPDALNVNIPNSTLDQLLEGNLVANCYVCNTCIDENNPTNAMSTCELIDCPSRTCWFLAAQNSPRNFSNCGNLWSFTSGCRRDAAEAQVDMTLKYNLRTRNHVLYEMEAVCKNDRCNNFTVFRELKQAININPNLDCLNNIGNSTTLITGSTTRATSPGASVTTPSPAESTSTTPAPGSAPERLPMTQLVSFCSLLLTIIHLIF